MDLDRILLKALMDLKRKHIVTKAGGGGFQRTGNRLLVTCLCSDEFSVAGIVGKTALMRCGMQWSVWTRSSCFASLSKGKPMPGVCKDGDFKMISSYHILYQSSLSLHIHPASTRQRTGQALRGASRHAPQALWLHEDVWISREQTSPCSGFLVCLFSLSAIT